MELKSFDPNTDLRAVAYESADAQKHCCLGELASRASDEAEEERVRRLKILSLVQRLHEARQHPETTLGKDEMETLIYLLDSLNTKLTQLNTKVEDMDARVRMASIALTGRNGDELGDEL